MRRIIKKLFRQTAVSGRWGSIKQSAIQMGIYITMLNVVLLSITAYSSDWVQDFIVKRFGLNLLTFELIIFGIIICMLIFTWKIDMPSFFKSWNNQFWMHDNPVKKELNEIKKQLDRVENELKELKGGDNTGGATK